MISFNENYRKDVALWGAFDPKFYFTQFSILLVVAQAIETESRFEES